MRILLCMYILSLLYTATRRSSSVYATERCKTCFYDRHEDVRFPLVSFFFFFSFLLITSSYSILSRRSFVVSEVERVTGREKKFNRAQRKVLFLSSKRNFEAFNWKSKVSSNENGNWKTTQSSVWFARKSSKSVTISWTYQVQTCKRVFGSVDVFADSKINFEENKASNEVCGPVSVRFSHDVFGGILREKIGHR